MIDPQALAILDFLQEVQKDNPPDRMPVTPNAPVEDRLMVLERSLQQAIDWIRAYCEREIEEPEETEQTETTPFEDERASGLNLAHLMPSPPEETPQLIYPTLQFAKITGLFNTSDATWTDFPTDSFQSHCEARVCEAGETGATYGLTLHLKLTEDPANAMAGFMNLSAGDVIGWVPGDHTEAVPGATDVYFDGYVMPNVVAPWMNLAYPDEDNTFKMTDHIVQGCVKCSDIEIDRSGRIVGFADLVPNWFYTKDQF